MTNQIGQALNISYKKPAPRRDSLFFLIKKFTQFFFQRILTFVDPIKLENYKTDFQA